MELNRLNATTRKRRRRPDSKEEKKKKVMYLFVNVSLLECYLYVYMCISIQKACRRASFFVPLYVCVWIRPFVYVKFSLHVCMYTGVHMQILCVYVRFSEATCQLVCYSITKFTHTSPQICLARSSSMLLLNPCLISKGNRGVLAGRDLLSFLHLEQRPSNNLSKKTSTGKCTAFRYARRGKRRAKRH